MIYKIIVQTLQIHLKITRKLKFCGNNHPVLIKIYSLKINILTIKNKMGWLIPKLIFPFWHC